MNFLSHFKNKNETLQNRRDRNGRELQPFPEGFPGLKSSVTIYLILVLVVIMALICTLIESGRVSAINARLRSITYMAADSVFAEFAQPLFDRYGVMMLWMDEEEFIEKTNEYIQENLDLSGTGAGMDMDLYGMRYQGSELTAADWIVDQGGKAFSEQVFEYMQIHAAEGIAEDLLSRTSYFEQTTKVRKVLGRLDDYQEQFADVAESAADLYEKTQKLKDLSENPKSLLDELGQTLDDFENGDRETAAANFEYEKGELARSKNELAEEITGIRQQGEVYQKNTDVAKEAIQSVKEEFHLNEQEMDPEVYQVLQKKMEDLETAQTSGDGNGQGLEKALETTEEYSQLLEGLDDYFAATSGGLSEETCASFRQMTEQYKNEFDQFDLSSLEAEDGDEGSGHASSSFIRKVRKTYQTGLLDMVAGEVSEKAVNKETLPSVTCNRESSSTEEEESFVDKSTQKLLFCEYIREHFGCFTNVKEENVLDYEMEYILAGKDNDRDNLSSAVTKLVLLRCGSNLLSLMMDNEKQAEIRLLAAEIAGATLQIYVAKIVELVLTLIWALAEAMIDAQQLLKGKRVPMIKQTDDWYFSLEGLRNFTGEEDGGDGIDQGLSYEEYLMILLLMEGKEKQVFQTMDVIQANLCDAETEEFRIKDCLAGVTFEAKFTAPGVFAGLPVVRRTFAAGGEGYGFQFTQSYTY